MIWVLIQKCNAVRIAWCKAFRGSPPCGQVRIARRVPPLALHEGKDTLLPRISR